MTRRRFNSFEEFWPHYLAEHSKPETRALHAVGSTVSLAYAVTLVVKGKWKLLPLALVPGYGAAWLSHFLLEKNRPATFDHPLWSLSADYKMIGMMINGTLDAELTRAGSAAITRDEVQSRKAR